MHFLGNNQLAMYGKAAKLYIFPTTKWEGLLLKLSTVRGRADHESYFASYLPSLAFLENMNLPNLLIYKPKKNPNSKTPPETTFSTNFLETSGPRGHRYISTLPLQFQVANCQWFQFPAETTPDDHPLEAANGRIPTMEA